MRWRVGTPRLLRPTQQSNPANNVRNGCPDPLIYYLHAAALAHTQMISAAAGSSGELPDHYLDAPTRKMLETLTVWDVADASNTRLHAMLTGIDMWRDHPFQRDAAEPRVIWSNAGARLLDYGAHIDGQPVLVVPSLINKPYILDLLDDVSFLKRMSKNKLRPVLLDWGDASTQGATHSIEGYLCEILLPAFKHLAETHKTRPSLLGYCMGGTLATALAAHLKDEVAHLALIGAPWDFSKLKGASKALKLHHEQLGTEKLALGLNAMGEHFGAVPASIFQQLFAVLSPMQVVQKFSRFAHCPQDSAQAHKFVAVEDWLADGSSVSASAAKTILIDWYIENQTAENRWEVWGGPVDPRNITAPTMIVTGQKDHIVPTEVATALIDLIPDATHVPVAMGHVGMIVGSNAHALVADRISLFFNAR